MNKAIAAPDSTDGTVGRTLAVLDRVAEFLASHVPAARP